MMGTKPITVELDVEDVALLRNICFRFKKLEERLPDRESRSIPITRSSLNASA